MEILNNKIRDLIENIGKDSNSKFNYQINTEIKELFKEIPIELLSENQVSLVLSEDIYLELGNPQISSCRLLVPVDKSEELKDGKITVIGPEISKDLQEGSILPFSQIIFIHSNNSITPDFYRKLQIHISVFNILKGFMIRAVPRKFWIRLSKGLIKLNFNLEILGKFLIFHVKKLFLEISGIEIVFITTAEDKIKDLEKISTNIKDLYSNTKIRKKLKEIEKGEIENGSDDDKKRYECNYAWSCSDCEYNDVCDEIIDIIKKMKQYRKNHNL